jgi:ferrous iron transport protein B
MKQIKLLLKRFNVSTPVIALAGSPNAGKTALFNALTGSNQKVGNYPGVTVEKKTGTATTLKGKVKIIDLPGTYSLDPHSPDEEVAVKVLLNRERLVAKEDDPQVVVAVADATNLERTLGLVVELKKIGKPVIVALNMMDLAQRRGLKLDINILSRELGIKVVPTIATKKSGIDSLLGSIQSELDSLDGKPAVINSWTAPDENELLARFSEVEKILSKAVLEPTSADIWTRRIDSVLLHPILGGVILSSILFLMFQAVFSWAAAPMDLIDGGVGVIGEVVASIVPAGLIQDLLVDGIIAGVGSVIIFLPQIIILFALIIILEGSGYMMRAAFIMDKMMSLVGLQGRSFVPLLSSFACAIPGIMATRSIKNPRDRLITIMVAPLMTCSARLPVYVLLIGAFIPNTTVMGYFGMQGVAMFGLFVAGILSAMVVAFVMKKVALPGPKSPFIMELPTYKWPSPRYVVLALIQRGKAFLKKAGTIIMGVSVGLWVLSTFPKAPADYDQPAINYSIAGRIGHFIEPAVAPLGFDWRIATGLIPGFAAREVMVGALGTVFAVENADDEGEGTANLQSKIKGVWPMATGLSLLAWYIFAPQCLATIAVARRETNSWKWAFIMFAYLMVLAYVSAFFTFQIFK